MLRTSSFDRVAQEMSVLLQMAEIRFSIMPALAGRGPETFSTKRAHDAKRVIEHLEKMYGDGKLKDSKGAEVRPDPLKQLEAGDYTFTKGKTHTARSQHSQALKAHHIALLGAMKHEMEDGSHHSSSASAVGLLGRA